VAQCLILNKLLPVMIDIDLNLTAKRVLSAGATELKALVPAPQLPILLKAYAEGLDSAFVVSTALSGMALLVSFAFEWRSVKPRVSSDPRI
jgi:hypothetical protein